jgi:hypothetical protein
MATKGAGQGLMSSNWVYSSGNTLLPIKDAYVSFLVAMVIEPTPYKIYM